MINFMWKYSDIISKVYLILQIFFSEYYSEHDWKTIEFDLLVKNNDVPILVSFSAYTEEKNIEISLNLYNHLKGNKILLFSNTLTFFSPIILVLLDSSSASKAACFINLLRRLVRSSYVSSDASWNRSFIQSIT